MTCRHCEKATTIQARGLCRPCWNRVKDQYPVIHDRAPLTKPWDIVRCRTDPPPFPTVALPGTAAKVLILSARFDAQVDLWHEADATRG